MKFAYLIDEMALAPKSRSSAEKRASILPANKHEAKKFIDSFWSKFLSDNKGSSSKHAVAKPPSAPSDETIAVVRSQDADNPFAWLNWHAAVTFRIVPGISFTMFVSTLDEPGLYRIDYVLLGAKKAQIDLIRHRVTNYVKKAQEEIRSSLTPDEQVEFNRIKTSIRRVPHTHKEGMREDDKLIGRLIMDGVPLRRLPEKAEELSDITRTVGDLIYDVVEER